MKRITIAIFCVSLILIQLFSSCSSSKVACPSFEHNTSKGMAFNRSSVKHKMSSREHTMSKKHKSVASQTSSDVKFISDVKSGNGSTNSIQTRNNEPVLLAADNDIASLVIVDNSPKSVTKPIVTENPFIGEKSSGLSQKQIQKLEKVLEKQMSKIALKGEKKQQIKSTKGINNANDTAKADKFALAGGILGIISLVLPFLGFGAAIAGVALCAIALKRGTTRRGLALAGLICGAIGIFLFFVYWSAIVGIALL